MAIARPVAAVVLGLALLAGACSSAPVATPDDPTLAAGQQVYNARCASCHGLEGGGGLGPALAGRMVEEYPDVGDHVAVVANGIPGTSMRAFAGVLSPEEIDAVVAYTRQSL